MRAKATASGVVWRASQQAEKTDRGSAAKEVPVQLCLFAIAFAQARQASAIDLANPQDYLLQNVVLMVVNMSLSNGRHYLAIPGPSVMPDRVLQAMHTAAPNIYHGDLVDMVPGLLTDLKKVARTDAHAAIYICNGHGVWEASLANVVGPGDKVLVPVTGAFGHGWAEMAHKLGAEPITIDFGKRNAIDPTQVAEALRADEAHEIKAVLAVFVDTSTSVRNDIQALRVALNEADHPALLMSDCIASMGCDRFEMDAWGVDVAITGSQKGLMTPPGLGFVFFNDKADRVRGQMERVSGYWDWRPRIDPDIFYQYFCGTAPTHHLYGLRAALDMIGEEGIENIWARHEVLANAIWAAFDAWGEGHDLQLNVEDIDARSRAVTSVRVGTSKATDLRQWCEEKAGVTLGIGLGMAAPEAPEWHHFFRLGHMGHVNAHMVLGALASIQAGMKAVGLPHNSGGLEAATQVIANNAIG